MAAASNPHDGLLSSRVCITDSVAHHSELRVLSAQTQKDRETSLGLKENSPAFVVPTHHALERDSGDVDCA